MDSAVRPHSGKELGIIKDQVNWSYWAGMGLEDRSEGKFNKVENFDIYHGQLDFPHEYKTVEIYITN